MIANYKHYFAVIVVLLSACAAIIPNEHVITKERLSSTIQRNFPIHQESGLFRITVDSPQINLYPSQNRIGMNGHFLANFTVLDIEGDFAFSSQPRYIPEQRVVSLQGVRLDSLNLKNGIAMPEIMRTKLNQMLNDYAANNPVYQIKPDELVVLGIKVEVNDISVVQEGLLLKLRTTH